MQTYTQSQFAKKLGICRRTLNCWDRSGVFKAFRDKRGLPYYTENDIIRYQDTMVGDSARVKGRPRGSFKTRKDVSTADMLNFINTLSDDMAEYLKDAECLTTENHRRIDLFVSHKDELFVFGYLNDDLVWFSRSSLNDTFLSRRIFECIKQSVFYRKADIEDVMREANITADDLYGMCGASLDAVETDKPVFSGCISNDNNIDVVHGMDFANFIAVVPKRLREMINDIGTENDILSALDADYQELETLYGNGVDCDDTCKDTIRSICNKWRDAECLKLCRRASVRTQYIDICHFDDRLSIEVN